MTKQDIVNLLNGDWVEVGDYGNKIQVQGDVFVLLGFVFFEDDEEMFEVVDGFINIEKAIKMANKDYRYTL